jgi:hypothetical protein
VVDNVYRYNYDVTAEGVYWIPALAEDERSSIRFLNFATGASTELAKIEKTPDLGLSVSPDRRSLLFTQRDYQGEDLMVVENFR